MINRIDWVDYAKGIGIVLVVYAHVLRGVNSAGLGLSKQFFYFSDTLVYGFHMPLFFFLSGMFSDKWVNKNTKETIIIKAKALLYPYVIWSLLQGSINIMLSSYTNKSMDWTNLIEISYKPIGQFWFLYVLFIFFMFYYFLRKIIGINKTLFVALICYILQPAFKDLWILSAILSQFIFFVAGSFFVAHKTSLPFWSDNKVMHLAFSLVFFLLINYLYIYGNYKYYFFQIFVSLVGIYVIFALSRILSQYEMLKIFKCLGIMSMPIYLAHILAASGVRIILINILGIENIFLHILAGTIFGVLLPLLCYVIAININLNKYLYGRDSIRRKICCR